MNVSPPVNLQELVRRANALSGITLQQLANQVNITVPYSTHSAKGWAGNLLEIALGADAKNAPEPDFRKLKDFRKSLKNEEVEIMKEVAKIKREDKPVWGV